MSEPTNDPPLVLRPEVPSEVPPLVLRPEEAPEVPRVEPPRKPRPGFWEAVLWCLVFLAGQYGVLIATTIVVFAVAALQAPDLTAFLDSEFKKPSPENAAERQTLPPVLAKSLGWGMVAAPLSSVALIAIVLPRRIGPDWKRQIGVRRPHGLHVALIVLLFPGFAVAPDVIELTLQWATGWKLDSSAQSGALKDIFGNFPWVCTALAIAIGPGVVEEFWCRGFLGRGLCSRYGFVGGILMTSCLFAAMHLNPVQFLVYVFMGAFLHFIYLASRSIWISILLHVLNNGTVILLSLTLTPEQVSKPTPVELWIAAYALLISGGFALWTSRARVEPLERGNEVWTEREMWKPEYPGISAPPPDANARIDYTSKYPIVKWVSIAFTVASFAWLVLIGYRALFQN